MVLLIDEADALLKQRDDPNDVGELKRVVDSVLQALDAFSGSQSIVVMASNHQYLFDPALWRRFDDVVEFPVPDAGKREGFLKYLLNGVHFDGALSELAPKMARLSYSDIQRVVIEAIKTMLLEKQDTLRIVDLLKEVNNWKTSLQNAKKRDKATTK